MFIKNGTYRDVSIAGLTAPIYEGTVLTESGAIAKADGSDAFGIVPENIYIMPPTKMTRVAIGGTIDLQDPANAHVTISKAIQDALSADINFIPGAGALPVVDTDDNGKFLVVEEGKWSAGGTEVIENAVGDWLDAHPEATTTVQDGSVNDAKLAQAGGVLSEVHDVRVGADGVTYASAGAAVRGQISNVNEDLSLIVENGKKTIRVTEWELGAYNKYGKSNDNTCYRNKNLIYLPDGRYVFKATTNTYISLFSDVSYTNGESPVWGATGDIIIDVSGKNYVGFMSKKDNDGIPSTHIIADSILSDVYTEVSKLDHFYDTGEIECNILFEQGNLNGSTGATINATNAVRSPNYITDAGSYVIHPHGQKVYVYNYTINGAMAGNLGWGITTDFKINFTSANKIKLVVMKPDNSTFIPDDCLVEMAKISAIKNAIPKNTGDFRTICHQGYSENDSLGRNRLSGFAKAKKMGFDWAECDLKITSDNKLVCCHDASFVDQSTQETIIIANHTLAELQECNYYGETIATFEDVVKSCKLNGLGLAIDQLYANVISLMLPIVKKYAMQRQVAYILAENADYPDYAQTLYNMITEYDPCAHIMLISYAATMTNAIAHCNSMKNANNKVELYITHTDYNVSQMISLQEELNSNVNIAVWTIDDLNTANNYLPYVSAICSNKISSTNLFD